MVTIFELRNINGTLVAQCLSQAACEREAKWRDLSGWTITEARREPSWGYGNGLPRRYVAPWPKSKIEEFRSRYMGGESMRHLEEYFDSAISRLCKLARDLELPHRATWEERWEHHGGRWTPREDDFVRKLYEDKKWEVHERGLPAVVAEIAAETNRTVKSVYYRIMYKSYTGEWSTDEVELINFMRDEGMHIHEIAEHLKVLPAAIAAQLRGATR